MLNVNANMKKQEKGLLKKYVKVSIKKLNILITGVINNPSEL